MNKAKFIIMGLIICLLLTSCAKSGGTNADYGNIKSDFSGMSQETAMAYIAVMDELAMHIGYEDEENPDGEYLHGGFVRDWDGDGTPELCLLLKTSPRDPDDWFGMPVYGWYAPTLYLYTIQNGQAVCVEKCDLYFATGGREAAIAALPTENGMQCVWWDHTLDMETYVDCIELINGKMERTELPAKVADASQNAKTAKAFLKALGNGKAQLLLYNNSGEAKIEGKANARALREALVAKAP